MHFAMQQQYAIQHMQYLTEEQQQFTEQQQQFYNWIMQQACFMQAHKVNNPTSESGFLSTRINFLRKELDILTIKIAAEEKRAKEAVELREFEEKRTKEAVEFREREEQKIIDQINENQIHTMANLILNPQNCSLLKVKAI
jgi:hypothetical protein